jgi:hypothetical protein
MEEQGGQGPLQDLRAFQRLTAPMEMSSSPRSKAIGGRIMGWMGWGRGPGTNAATLSPGGRQLGWEQRLILLSAQLHD